MSKTYTKCWWNWCCFLRLNDQWIIKRDDNWWSSTRSCVLGGIRFDNWIKNCFSCVSSAILYHIRYCSHCKFWMLVAIAIVVILTSRLLWLMTTNCMVLQNLVLVNRIIINLTNIPSLVCWDCEITQIAQHIAPQQPLLIPTFVEKQTETIFNIIILNLCSNFIYSIIFCGNHTFRQSRLTKSGSAIHKESRNKMHHWCTISRFNRSCAAGATWFVQLLKLRIHGFNSFRHALDCEPLFVKWKQITSNCLWDVN